MLNLRKKIIDLQIHLRSQIQKVKDQIIAPSIFFILDLLGIPHHLPYTHTVEEAQKLIYNKLTSPSPCMIGRIGATEIRIMEGVLHEKEKWYHKIKWFIMGHQTHLSQKIITLWGKNALYTDDKFFYDFTRLMMNNLKYLDVFATWRWEEFGIFQKPYFFERISLRDLEPFFSNNPWTKALKNKKVLVINPFDETIKKQYLKREKLFTNPDILPEFDLITYKPFYKNNRPNDHIVSWFDQLNLMKKEISKIDFDIALISAGPFGFPLAAEIKRSGKKSIIIGGVLQILFGIIGKRWERLPHYKELINQDWCHPDIKDRPKDFFTIEGGCYW